MDNFVMFFKTNATKYISLNAVGAVILPRVTYTPPPRDSGYTEVPSPGGSRLAGLAPLPWARLSLASGPVPPPLQVLFFGWLRSSGGAG